jgi:hypothetical protein
LSLSLRQSIWNAFFLTCGWLLTIQISKVTSWPSFVTHPISVICMLILLLALSHFSWVYCWLSPTRK